MSISKSVRLPMFLHVFKTHLEQLHKQTNLPNLCPKPPKLPQWYLHFAMYFTFFSNGTTGPKPAIKQPKVSLQPLKWENCQRVRSRSFTFVLFCQLFNKNQQQTRKQEPPKKNRQNKIAHPKGGAIAEMPSRICQCLHSSDIAIADVPSVNCQCSVRASEGVPFWKKSYKFYLPNSFSTFAHFHGYLEGYIRVLPEFP